MKYYARTIHSSSLRITLAALSVAAAVVACSSESPAPGAQTDDQATEPGSATGDAVNDGTGAKPGGDAEHPASPSGDAPPPAAGPCKKAPPSKACGVAPQCGCAANETCDVPDASGYAVCSTAGTLAMGQPCAGTSSCARGLTCIFGTCHAFCDNPGGSCSLPGTYGCEQIKTTTNVDVPNLAICRIACSPEDPATCGGATAEGVGVCYADGKGGTDCQSGTSKVEGDECGAKEACGPGLVCTTVKTTSKSTCKKWCRVGKTDCGTGKACNGFNPEVKVGDVAYGACP